MFPSNHGPVSLCRYLLLGSLLGFVPMAACTMPVDDSSVESDVRATTAGGCPASGYQRLVSVSTESQLKAAFSNAKPGDQIELAAGTYSGDLTFGKSGTTTDRIVLCGASGVWPVIHGNVKIYGAYLLITGLVFTGPNNSQNDVYITGTHDVVFSGNEVRNSDFHAGIAMDYCSRVSITKNYIHDNGLDEIDHGIYFRHQTGPNLIANNVIANNHGRGISMHDNNGLAISDATVVNNTIVRNGSTGILVSVNAGTGDVIANNVCDENGWIYNYKQIRSKTGSGNLITHNIAYSSDASRSGIEDGADNIITANIVQDPLFEVPYTDLHVRSGSPAIGAALAQYAPADDFDGKKRDTAPDVGAYEY